jgi:hypothetical protein
MVVAWRPELHIFWATCILERSRHWVAKVGGTCQWGGVYLRLSGNGNPNSEFVRLRRLASSPVVHTYCIVVHMREMQNDHPIFSPTLFACVNK